MSLVTDRGVLSPLVAAWQSLRGPHVLPDGEHRAPDPDARRFSPWGIFFR
jgi:hypothetical protein